MYRKLRTLIFFTLSLLASSSAEVASSDHVESIVPDEIEKASVQLFNILSRDRDRHLSSTPCDTVILEIPIEGVVEVFGDLVDALAPNPIIAAYIKALFANYIQYGVKIVKMCASCDSAVATGGLEDLYKVPEFSRYCGTDVYGHDMDHSGMVMYPIVGSGQDMKIKLGTLPGYVYSRPSKLNVLEAPSENWGQIDTVFGFVATITAGAVSFAPDMMGYGSTAAAVKSYLIRDSYLTSTIPLWLQAGTFLKETSNCETALADASFYLGGSEGGYATVAIADGLHKALNVEPISTFAAAGPYRMGTATLLEAVLNADEGTFPEKYNNLAVLLGAAYSSTNPTNANFGENQDLLKSKHRKKLLRWLADPDVYPADMNEKLSALMEEEGVATVGDAIVDPFLLEFIRTAIEDEVPDMCDPEYEGYVVGKNDKICEALKQNDLLDVLHTASYPIKLCHSPDDKVVTYKNLPDFEKNPNLSLIDKEGPHDASTSACLFEGLFYLASEEFRNFEPVPKHSEGGCAPSCSDSPLEFVWKGKTKDCNWVSQETKRCNFGKGKIAKHCPFTCDKCDANECMNSPLKFYLNEKERTCKWVKKKKFRETRCALDGVLETCRKICADKCQ